jgi:hypothetical protein
MYEAPNRLKKLQDDLKDELDERSVNRHYALLVSKVELGFELLNLIRLEEEPVGVLWVILSQTPIRHPHLQRLDNAQQRAIANARILLPGYAGRFGWEAALRDYIRQVPIEMRRYDFDIEQLDRQIVHACRTEREFRNRTEVYQECLTHKLPFSRRSSSYVEAGTKYSFSADIQGESLLDVTVQFNEDLVALKDTTVAWVCAEPPKREAIQITWQDLENVARFIDNKMGGDEWINRLNQIIYRRADDLQADAPPESILLDGFTHLAGMVASGKSTLANLIAAHLVYDHMQNPSSPKRRVTLELGDSASTIQLADDINQWFGLDPEKDQPVAVPLLGRSRRDKHVRQLHESQEYKTAVQEQRTHWGERFLNTACPLQSLIPLDALSKPLKPGTEPCSGLRKSPETSKNGRQRHSTCLCPLFAVCPSQQLYRDMAGAQIWITTPGAMGAAALPAQLETRSIRLGDLIYEQSDLVVLDEVETVMEWFDRLYARETKLTGDGQGILDVLDPALASYQTQKRMFMPADTKRWVEAERNFSAPVGHVLALVQRHQELQASVERGYFTSGSLFYRLARRTLGMKEYEDERDDVKRRKNEQVVESIMPVFDVLMGGGDPLANPMPANFRADHKVTVETLRKLRRKYDDLPRDDPARASILKNYQDAVQQVAHQLIIFMNSTLNTGDSTQNPEIHQWYRSWILQFVPDLEQRLAKLKEQLETSEDERDRQYLDNKQVDTLDILSYRLEFAVNAALLDRHIRIVFYEWHNRPTELIDDESPYRKTPTSLLNILPLPPTGRLFGIYHTPNNENSAVLSTFGYTNIGRKYVTNFHRLRAHLEDQTGPNVLAMSGTSYLPDSTSWHLDTPPKGVLKPADKCVQALQDKNTWFRFMPVYDKADKPIRVSGIDDKRGAIIKMAAALVGSYGDRGSRLGQELRQLQQLAEKDPDNWADRDRLLLLVNSYDQSKWVAEEMQSRWGEMAAQIYYLESSGSEEDEPDDGDQIHTSLQRVDIEEFAQGSGKILVAPLQAIGRRFNILNANSKAAFGAVYFLTRPMPHPHDIPAIAQELNRRTQDWFEDSEFVAWKEGDSVYARGIELRRRAEDYWRRVELRKFYSQLHDEKDNSSANADKTKMHANPRRDLAATTAGKVIQAVGRLLRGNVPFHAYFVDAAWGPQQAQRLMGEDVSLDTPKTSLLAALIDVMADYVADPLGEALYKPLLEKLEQTQNFDWQPIE